MRLLPVAAAFLLVAAWACTEYQEAGGPQSPPAEAGADSAPAGEDAAADAPADAPPSGFCAAKGDAAVICQDFDSLTDVTSLVPSSSVGNPDLSGRTFVSPPRSLRFLMPDMKSAPQYTVVSYGIATEQDVRLELDWRWEAATSTEGQTLQSVTLRKDVGQASVGRACGLADAGVIPCTWYIAVTPDVGKPAALVTFAIPPPAALTKWSHVAFQVTFASEGHVYFAEDGVALVDVATPTLASPSTAPVGATIGLAILQASTSLHELLFDNVFLELR